MLASHCPGYYHLATHGARRTGRLLNVTHLRSGAIRVPTFAEFVHKLALLTSDGAGGLPARHNRSGGLHQRVGRHFDQHFTLQSERCGLWPAGAHAPPSAVPSVQFLLRMGSPTFYADLDALFALAGLNASLRHAYFPGQSSANHRTRASAKLAQFYDRAVARLALRLYARDYEAFGLPWPDVESFPERLD